ncbi:terpene synthase family protein [Saccharopolyspora terrae]|nr:hypothetical protein [Saccharopolyspora terrae]
MPQTAELRIPFEVTPVAEDLEPIRQASLDWLSSNGMLRSAEAKARFVGWKMTELASLFYPQATGEDLLLGANQMGFFFLFDDQFDDPRGLRNEAVAAYHELIELLQQPPGTPPALDVPVTRAWAQIWEESCRGMSLAWQRRAAQDWGRWFTGYPVEALRRQDCSFDTLDEYLDFRRSSIGVDPVLSMCERAQHFEVPLAVFHTPQMQVMRRLTADVTILANDVQSLEKEAHRNDVLNAVLLLERTRKLHRNEAIQETADAVHRMIDEFEKVEESLNAFCATLQLSDEDRENATKYVRLALGPTMWGNYEWGRTTGRYDASSTSHNMRPADVANYLEDLVSPEPAATTNRTDRS